MSWISVEDNLPAYAIAVLVHDENGNTTVGWRTSTDQYGENWNRIGRRGCTVTHWQPLPVPPIKQEVKS
jgi:hypothetical protein